MVKNVFFKQKNDFNFYYFDFYSPWNTLLVSAALTIPFSLRMEGLLRTFPSLLLIKTLTRPSRRRQRRRRRRPK